MTINFYKKVATVLVAAFLFLSCNQETTKAETNNPISKEMQVAIDHYAINVADLNRSVDFYQKVFGLQEIKNGTGLAHIKWLRLGTLQELHIIQVDSLEKKLPKGVHLALAVSDFDRFRESIETLNLDYSDWPGSPKAISTRPDNVRQLYFQDPDGYWVEVNDGKQF